MNLKTICGIKTVWILVLIAGLALTAYSFSLNGSFRNIDDRFSIVDKPTIKDIKNIGKIFQGGFFNDHSYYRPLVSLNFMLEYHCFGANAFYYYLNNIILHTLTAMVVFFIAGILLKDRALAAGAAFLFAIHPIQWEAVANIPGRSNLLCTFLHLAAFWFFLLFQDGKSRRFYYLSLLTFFLSLFSKESAVMLPVILIWYLWLENPNPFLEKIREFKIVIPFLGLIVFYACLRKVLGVTELFHWPSVLDLALGFLTFLRGVLTYLRLFLFPIDLHFDRARKIFSGFIDPELWMTIFFYVILIFLLVKYRKRIGTIFLFCIGWFFIELFPVSQIISSIGTQPGYISLAEHFLYSASAPIFILMVFSWQKITEILNQKRILTSLSVACLTGGSVMMLFLTTIQNNIYASSELAMLERSLHFNPNNTRILYSVGFLYADNRQFKEAEKYFRKVLELEPWNAMGRISLGKSLCDQERYFDGVTEYEKVIYPGLLKELHKNNLRLAYKILIEKYQQMINKDPNNARLYYSQGIILSKNHEIQEAMNVYHKALELDPNLKEALFNLGSTFAGQGNLDEAIPYYERVIGLSGSPDELERMAYQHLGHIYEQKGDKVKSAEYFRKVESVPIGPALHHDGAGPSK